MIHLAAVRWASFGFALNFEMSPPACDISSHVAMAAYSKLPTIDWWSTGSTFLLTLLSLHSITFGSASNFGISHDVLLNHLQDALLLLEFNGFPKSVCDSYQSKGWNITSLRMWEVILVWASTGADVRWFLAASKPLVVQDPRSTWNSFEEGNREEPEV